MYENSKEKVNPFHAVIMSLTIAGSMGSKEAINQLLEMDPSAKVIVSSGYSNDPVMADFQRYGFHGMVNKPYKMSELQLALEKVLTTSTGTFESCKPE